MNKVGSEPLMSQRPREYSKYSLKHKMLFEIQYLSNQWGELIKIMASRASLTNKNYKNINAFYRLKIPFLISKRSMTIKDFEVNSVNFSITYLDYNKFDFDKKSMDELHQCVIRIRKINDHIRVFTNQLCIWDEIDILKRGEILIFYHEDTRQADDFMKGFQIIIRGIVKFNERLGILKYKVEKTWDSSKIK